MLICDFYSCFKSHPHLVLIFLYVLLALYTQLILYLVLPELKFQSLEAEHLSPEENNLNTSFLVKFIVITDKRVGLVLLSCALNSLRSRTYEETDGKPRHLFSCTHQVHRTAQITGTRAFTGIASALTESEMPALPV